MFKVTRRNANRLDIEFSGQLDSDEMRQALDELLAQSEGIESGRMLFRVGEYRLPTLGAIGLELARLPQMLGFIGRFSRAAVLADQAWLQKISELEGKLIPGLEIKAFATHQLDEAEAWLAE